MRQLFFTCFALVFMAGACTANTKLEAAIERNITAPIPESSVAPVYIFTETPEPKKAYTDEEIEVIAQTLAGECYDDKTEDKRLVAEVIVNRVADGRFGDNVVGVVTAKNQFYGYWHPNREISESDLSIAEQVLIDWHENERKALSEYLYFCSGSDRENVFRAEY